MNEKVVIINDSARLKRIPYSTTFNERGEPQHSFLDLLPGENTVEPDIYNKMVEYNGNLSWMQGEKPGVAKQKKQLVKGRDMEGYFDLRIINAKATKSGSVDISSLGQNDAKDIVKNCFNAETLNEFMAQEESREPTRPIVKGAISSQLREVNKADKDLEDVKSGLTKGKVLSDGITVSGD